MICIICFDEIKEETRQLNCVHAFHEGCIEKWYKRSHRCPLCRKSKFDMKCEEFETHYFKEANKNRGLDRRGNEGYFQSVTQSPDIPYR